MADGTYPTCDTRFPARLRYQQEKRSMAAEGVDAASNVSVVALLPPIDLLVHWPIDIIYFVHC